MRTVRQLRWVCVVVAAVATSTCSDAVSPVVTRIDVSGLTTIYLGRTTQLHAVARGSGGQPIHRSVTWASSDTAVATIDGNGSVRGLVVGITTITATADGVSGSLDLTVRLFPVASVTVSPRVDSLLVGDSLRLGVTLRDSAGVPAAPRPLRWTSSDTTRGTVSDSGVVRAVAPGSFAVTAEVDGAQGGAFIVAQQRIVSLAMPDSLTLHRNERVLLIPDLRSASGARLADRAARWSSSDAVVAAVDAEGIISAREPGIAVVTAEAGGARDSTRIIVFPAAVTLLTASTSRWPLPGDSTVAAFRATLYDSNGGHVSGWPVTWTSSDTTIVLVWAEPADSRTGIARGVATGSATITASAAGRSASFPVAVAFPPVRIDATPESLAVFLGAAAPITVAETDRFGFVTRQSSPTLLSLDTTVVRWDGTWVWGVAPGRAAAVATAAGGLTDTVVVTVLPTSGGIVRWNLPWITLGTNQTDHVGLEATDSAPGRGYRGIPVRIVSLDTTVAVASPDRFDSLGAVQVVTVYSRGPGVTTVLAHLDSVAVPLHVVVNPGGTLNVVVWPRPATLTSGDTVQLTVGVTGSDGEPYASAVHWSSSDTAVATVSGTGLLRAHGQGDAVIRAVAGVGRDSFRLAVTSPTAVISYVGPRPLVPGQVMYVFGSGFDPLHGNNTITVGGAPAEMTAASDTLLMAIVPPLPCAAPRVEWVELLSGGRRARQWQYVETAPERSMAVGTATTLAGAEMACNQFRTTLSPSPAHLVVVTNIAGDVAAADTTEFRVGGGSLPTLRAGDRSAGNAPTTWSIGATRIAADSVRRAVLDHARLLAGSRAAVQRAGAPAPLLDAARRAGPQRVVTATVNGIARIRVPRVDRPDFCASHTSIDARLAYVGSHVKIFEDVSGYLARTLDTVYQAVGEEFDAVTWPLLLANFGDPTALDHLLDADGRIAVVLSPLVNASGAAAFVVSCDFYPESVFPSSNTGEIVYAMMPTVLSTGYNGMTPPLWRWVIRSVLAHEGKHVAAFATRLSRGLPLEEIWLEEGSAVLAEEVWARTFHHIPWKGNATYRQTLYCEIRPVDPECSARAYGMFEAHAFLHDYLLDPQRHSPFGPTDVMDATFYGSAWSLLRWTVDHYAASESAFLRALVTEPATGAAKLEALAAPVATILPQWALSLYADGRSGVGTALSDLSWNLADIFRGMSQDVAGFSARPLSPGPLGAGDEALVGGASRYAVLDGLDWLPSTHVVLQLFGFGGAVAPVGTRLSIFRER